MSAADLWDDYQAAKAAGEPRHLRVRLWEAWVAQSCREGKRPDALRRDSLSRSERFDACCVPGLDGCLIWDGPINEHGNPKIPGCGRTARKYQLERNGVVVPSHRRVLPACGSSLCVRLEHLVVEETHWQGSLTEEQLIGRLQVEAARLGHTPTTHEWRELGLKPSEQTFRARLGGWLEACHKAGLAVATRAYRQTETHFACGCERTPENSRRNGTRPDGTVIWTCRQCANASQRRSDAKRRERKRAEREAA